MQRIASACVLPSDNGNGHLRGGAILARIGLRSRSPWCPRWEERSQLEGAESDVFSVQSRGQFLVVVGTGESGRQGEREVSSGQTTGAFIKDKVRNLGLILDGIDSL